MTFVADVESKFCKTIHTPTQMKPGIYHVKFSAVTSTNFGEGLAVFSNGTVNGGDPGYIYRGSYEISDSTITGTLRITRWNPAIPSIFGSFPEFELTLSGHMPPDSSLFYAEGKVVQNPALAITINGRRLADAA
jgi:hypothetical protein